MPDQDIEASSPETSIPNAIAHPLDIAPAFYDWREIYPELQVLVDHFDAIVAEARTVPKVKFILYEHSNMSKWIPWPEDHFNGSYATDWTVFPFFHTFPALDTSKSTWLESTCSHCPVTSGLLRTIPNIRTALFSRLGPGTKVCKECYSCLICIKIHAHTGWADLANYVLRCHLSLIVPHEDSCALIVEHEVRHHREGEILVFDDSKVHRAVNNAPEGGDRIVLIVDILRPSHIPLGTATGGHTKELDGFISQFR